MEDNVAIEYNSQGICPECGSDTDLVYTSNIEEQWFKSNKEGKILLSRKFECENCCCEGEEIFEATYLRTDYKVI